MNLFGRLFFTPDTCFGHMSLMKHNRAQSKLRHVAHVCSITAVHSNASQGWKFSSRFAMGCQNWQLPAELLPERVRGLSVTFEVKSSSEYNQALKI